MQTLLAKRIAAQAPRSRHNPFLTLPPCSSSRPRLPYPPTRTNHFLSSDPLHHLAIEQVRQRLQFHTVCFFIRQVARYCFLVPAMSPLVPEPSGIRSTHPLQLRHLLDTQLDLNSLEPPSPSC